MNGEVITQGWSGGLALAVGLGLSFWLVGKGNRRFWIAPALLLWFGLDAVLPKAIGDVAWLAPVAPWIVAAIVVASALLVRRLRRPPPNCGCG